MSHVEDLFSPLHLVIVLVIALLIFGPKRLPELGQGLGKSIREFRNATSGLTGTEDTNRAGQGTPTNQSGLAAFVASQTGVPPAAQTQDAPTAGQASGPGSGGPGSTPS